MRPDLFYMIDDLRRVGSEESQLARWDVEDCDTLAARISETVDANMRAYLSAQLKKLRDRAANSQRRAARHYAQARLILGID